ncbi:hypothetical protein PDJAM_G00176970 [Pangasius djambal]|uniref:Uncharacterized protein n=1 Tax=Pangasius djambal TaxID=1691987 RepID=A0ACC5ZPL0_9TELE|nr:hypothetical protein [Pangasius djambal]
MVRCPHTFGHRTIVYIRGESDSLCGIDSQAPMHEIEESTLFFFWNRLPARVCDLGRLAHHHGNTHTHTHTHTRRVGLTLHNGGCVCVCKKTYESRSSIRASVSGHLKNKNKNKTISTRICVCVTPVTAQTTPRLVCHRTHLTRCKRNLRVSSFTQF